MEDQVMADALPPNPKVPIQLTFQQAIQFNSQEICTSARFAPKSLTEDFSLLATSNLQGQVKLFSLRSDEDPPAQQDPVWETKQHFFPVNDVQFCQHARTIQPYLASCSDDTLINMYDMNKQKLVRCFIGHTSYVSHIKFNSISNVLLSAGCDNSLLLWDIRTNKAVFKILGHPEAITSIDISNDNTLLSSSSYDGYVRLWDMVKGSCLKTMVAESGSTSAISLCKMSPSSKQLLFANMNSKMSLYNLHNDLLKIYTGHKNQDYAMEALFMKHPKSGRMMVVSGSEDGRLIFWDLNSQEQVLSLVIDRNLGENNQLVNCICYDEQNGYIGAAGNFKGLYLYKSELL